MKIEPLKIRHGFIPWVKDVHKDLKRVIEPPGKTTWATPSKLLEILSTDEEYKFADKCNKVVLMCILINNSQYLYVYFLNQ